MATFGGDDTQEQKGLNVVCNQIKPAKGQPLGLLQAPCAVRPRGRRNKLLQVLGHRNSL
jgi:hypothetical protein